MNLEISPAWRSTYPGAAMGILALRGVANPGRHPEMEARKEALEARLRERLAEGGRPGLEALPAVRAYTEYYRPFKKTYHVLLQLESVVLKGKPIPTVAALVEAMFMSELGNQLLTAGHDLEAVQPPVRLDIARGGERYTLLRGSEAECKPGDMLMADASGVISSVIYGPDARTRLSSNTRRALFAVYAPPGIEPEAVRAHLEDLRDNVWIIAPQAEVESLEVYRAGE